MAEDIIYMQYQAGGKQFVLAYTYHKTHAKLEKGELQITLLDFDRYSTNHSPACTESLA